MWTSQIFWHGCVDAQPEALCLESRLFRFVAKSMVLKGTSSERMRYVSISFLSIFFCPVEMGEYFAAEAKRRISFGLWSKGSDLSAVR